MKNQKQLSRILAPIKISDDDVWFVYRNCIGGELPILSKARKIVEKFLDEENVKLSEIL